MTTKTTPNLRPDQVAILSEMEAWMARLKNHDVPLTKAETIRMLDFVMRVQGFIAYSNRENRRLVRERDAALDTVEDLVEHSAGESV